MSAICRARRAWTVRLWVLALLVPVHAFPQVTSPTPAHNPAAQGSLRLTFRFGPDRVELVRLERLQKVAPGQVLPVPVAGANSGSWLVLLDAEDKPLFYRFLNDPFRLRAEHHDANRGPSVHLRSAASGQFQAVLPAIPGGRFVVLFSSPRSPERMAEPARELARFRLDAP